jgi:hypothetical protein
VQRAERGKGAITDLKDVHWTVQIPQTVLAEIDQSLPLRDFGRRRGAKDLSAMTNRSQPGGRLSAVPK